MRLLPLLFLAACAQSQRGLPIADMATGYDSLSLDYDGAMAADLAMRDAAVDQGAVDLASCLSMVKVNEVQTGGSGSLTDEFIELYNPCSSAVDLTGSRLAYRSATNATASDTNVIAMLTGMIPAGGYYLVANANYSGSATPDIKPFQSSGLAATGGGVGLRDSVGTLIDSVGWGSANNPFVETAVVTAPAVSKSAARIPNGTDSNNNSADFTVGTPTPKAAN
jgi:predicted extracellular nuclease